MHTKSKRELMTRPAVLIALLLLLFSTDNSSISAAEDESKEPPLTYSVKFGNKSITVRERKTVRIKGRFQNPAITVAPQSYRVFPYQGISFKYPRSFAWEADLSDSDARNWTLSGNDFKIMYFVFNEPLTTADFANNMVNEIGKENCRVTDTNAQIILGKQTLVGTSLQLTLAGHTMVMDAYEIPSDDTGTRMLVLQDSLDNAGKRSSEGIEAIKVVKASFSVTR